MSYFNYVLEKGYQGNKVFDKYGDLSKRFKKFVTEKKGHLQMPDGWLYLPEKITHKFLYKPGLTTRTLNKLKTRRFEKKTKQYVEKQEKAKAAPGRKALNIEKVHGSGYVAFDMVDEQVKRQITSRNQPFELTLKSSKGSFRYVKKFSCLRHFERWLTQNLSNRITSEYGQWTILEDEVIDLLAHCKVKAVPIVGGCNKNMNVIKKFTIKRYNIETYNPVSMNNNCSFKCIEYLLNKPICGKDIYNIRKKYNIKTGDVVSADVLQKVYYEQGGKIHLVIVDENYDLEFCLDKYKYVLAHNNHYYVITKADRKEMNERKATKRGELYWDIETRQTEKYVMVGTTKSYHIKDTITCAYYRNYKQTEFQKITFVTNDNKSSVRQFLDWMINQSHDGKHYNCVAHNGARFDHYFLVSEFSEYEQLHANIQLRGYSLINIEFSNHQFKDSYCFMTASLDSLCKNYKIGEDSKKKHFLVNGKHLDNMELCFYKKELTFKEFMNLENEEPEYWNVYTDYCMYDCISLGKIWGKFSSETNSVIEKMGSYLLRNCSVASCSTVGSLAKKLVDNINKKNKYYHEYCQFMDNTEKYEFISNFKRGGISHVNQPGKHEHSVVSYDITSQYPTSLIKMKIPSGKSEWIDKYDSSQIGYYQITNLLWNKTKAFKPLAGKTENGVLDWCNPSEIMYLDSTTIQYLKKYYGLLSFDVIRGLVSNRWILGSLLFGTYVNTLFKEKAKQDVYKDDKDEKYNPAYREVIKLFLNSLTGKLVEDPSKYFTMEYTVDTDKETKSMNGINIKKDIKDKMNVWLNAGVQVYSYSKQLLFEYIRCLPNDSDDVINIETDSIYFDKKHQVEFVSNIKNYTGEYPVDIGGALGNVKNEYDTDETSFFLGKKMYYIDGTKKVKGIPLRTIDDDGRIKELVNKQFYEDIYGGKEMSIEFKTMKKQLFGETYISSHNMTRRVRPMMPYKLYQ